MDDPEFAPSYLLNFESLVFLWSRTTFRLAGNESLMGGRFDLIS
jgi:hypothetical protein